MTEYPVDGILPKKEIGAKDFLLKHPEYDGRGVKIAILDTGVDPGAAGLSFTSEGKPKIIDVYDATGSGDVDTSATVKVSEGTIIGLSGRVLKIPPHWENASGTYHIGLKSAYQLFPKALQERRAREVKKEVFNPPNRSALAKVYAALQKLDEEKPSKETQADKLLREDLQGQIDFLQAADKKYEDCGDVYDVVVFNDGKTWRACVDTSCSGDLASCTLMASFKEERQFGQFTQDDMMNYALNIYNEGNLLEIVTNSGSHGTHVAGIAAACYGESEQEKWGIAPGAQIISIKVGDGRLGSMETGTALARALVKVINCKADLINYSYGEAANWPDAGRVMDLINQAVDEHGVVFVSSVGNKGPSLSTVVSPGGNCSNIIGVAAYVSPPMMAANYAMTQELPGVIFTWSSRGPCVDGSLGVCMAAPGAAVAPVPNWTLKDSQLMNGTSMSSPNACGGIALILSALKAQKVAYNPYSIRRAIENTCKPLSSTTPFSQGHGLFRVMEAYDSLITHCGVSEGKVKFKVGVSGGMASWRMKGVYLRELHQVQTPSEHIVSVEPIFVHKDVDNNEKIRFRMRVALTCAEHWVQTAGHLEINNSTKQFTIKLNPLTLPSGVHFTQVLAYDINCQDKGPLFRVPITVIKPITVDSSSDFTWKADEVSFRPAENKRIFLHVPHGATRACIRVTSSNATPKAKFSLQCVQLHADEAFRVNEFEKFVNLNEKGASVNYLPVLGNKTMEVTVGRWWSYVGDLTLNISVAFNSLCPDDPKPIMFASNGIFRLNVTSTLHCEELTPCVTLKHLVTPVRPSEHKFRVLNDSRDQVPNRPCVHAVELTYNFSKSKPGEVTPDFAPLSGLLYENEFESQLWMLYNSHKRLIGCGDAYVDQYNMKLDKGDYILKLQIRNERRDLLERFKDWPISLHHRLSSPVSLDIYFSHQAAMLNSRKATTTTLPPSHTLPLFITPLPDDKLPKPVQAGYCLSGMLSFAKDDPVKKAEFFPFKYVLTDPVKKAKNNSPPTATATEATAAADATLDKSATVAMVEPVSDVVVKVDMKQKQTEYENALYDFKTSWIAKLNEETSSSLYEELIDEKPRDPAPVIAKLNALDSHKDRDSNLLQIVSVAEKALSLINIQKVVIYFSIKSDLHQQQSLKSNMEKGKSQLVECLVKLGCALCDHILQEKSPKGSLEARQPAEKAADKESKGESTRPSETDVKRLDEIFNDLFKLVETADSKVQTLSLKHALVHGHFGRALKILQKQADDKPSKELDEKIIEVCGLLNWKHIVNHRKRWLLLKYPPSYLPF